MIRRHSRLGFLYMFPMVFIFTCLGQAQTREQRLDSLKNKFIADSTRLYTSKKYKFLFALDTRNSFINSGSKIPVNVKGFQIGVVIKEHNSLALGFYAVSNFLKTQPVVGELNKKMNIGLNLGYATLFYEYTFIDTRRWQVGIPVEIGSGSYKRTATTTDSIPKPVKSFSDTVSKGILLFGTGLDVTFNIFKWLGFNAMGGYRIVSGNEPNGLNLNGAFYSVGFQLYLGELWRMYKFHHKRARYRHDRQQILSDQKK